MITQATGTAMGLHLTGVFESWLSTRKGKKGSISKKAVKQTKILEEKLLFDISLPLTTTFGYENLLLLIVEDSTDDFLLSMVFKIARKCGFLMGFYTEMDGYWV